MNYVISEATEKLKIKYDIELKLSKPKISGLKTIEIQKIDLFQFDKDTLIKIEGFKCNPSLLSIFKSSLVINDLYIDKLYAKLNNGRNNNFKFLFKQKKKDRKSNSSKIELNEMISNLVENSFLLIPQNAEINEVSLIALNDSSQEKAVLKNIKLSDNKFIFELLNENKNEGSNLYKVNGLINKFNRSLEFSIEKELKKLSNFSFLTLLTGIHLDFYRFNISLYESEKGEDLYNLKGKMELNNFYFNHPKISSTDVSLKYLSSNYSFFVKNESLGLDSSTTFQLNEIKSKIFVQSKINTPKNYSLKVNLQETPANSVFASLPKGLFNNFEGFNAKGTLKYNLSFHLDESKLDSVKFESDLKAKNFKIVDWGKSGINKLNGTFEHNVYEKNKLVRTFLVGEEIPNYKKLESISPVLQNAILISEDGHFYWHKGFNKEAFIKSIATNYKERKFKRGGSTITMQLVKNLFLNKKKTVARKIEEALIVWLLEENRIVSKEKMFELYLNIIEWGPNVYGIGEAADYYFRKSPDKLTTDECIFLAMIIPRPKYFYYNFDKEGNLKEYTKAYFKLISNHLVRKEVITEDEKDNLTFSVILTGNATEKIVNKSEEFTEEKSEEMEEVDLIKME